MKKLFTILRQWWCFHSWSLYVAPFFQAWSWECKKCGKKESYYKGRVK